MLSDEQVWEAYNALMLNGPLDEVEPATEEEIGNLGRMIAMHNVVGFNYDGLVWKYDQARKGKEFNLETVNRVAQFLKTIDRLFDQSPFSYTKWRSSYGLKHDMEFLRMRFGDESQYVSNGEFMAGYFHYLTVDVAMEPSSVRAKIKPEIDGGLNLFMKVSTAYQKIADIARNRGF